MQIKWSVLNRRLLFWREWSRLFLGDDDGRSGWSRGTLSLKFVHFMPDVVRYVLYELLTTCLGAVRRESRISARGGRQGNDDLIWDANERFLTYANTYLQLFKMFIAILCLNGFEQPFKRHQCPFFLPLRRGNPRLRRGSLRPRGGRPPQRPPPGSAPACSRPTFNIRLWLRLRANCPRGSGSGSASLHYICILSCETFEKHHSRSNRVSLFALEYTWHCPLAFRRETPARSVTCIPTEKARRDLNASDAVFLPFSDGENHLSFD